MMLAAILRPGKLLRTRTHATAVPMGKLTARVSKVSTSELVTSGIIGNMPYFVLAVWASDAIVPPLYPQFSGFLGEMITDDRKPTRHNLLADLRPADGRTVWLRTEVAQLV